MTLSVIYDIAMSVTDTGSTGSVTDCLPVRDEADLSMMTSQPACRAVAARKLQLPPT
jgi:hypothetical protein